MYQTVQWPMATSQARARLLAAAVEHALAAGIADLSLRELAAAIGTSHRMLIYHFGSREGLLVAVTEAVEEAMREEIAGTAITPETAWDSWRRLSDPALWPQERLFFELYAAALLGRPGTEGFLEGNVEAWLDPLARALVASGRDEEEARVDARLGVAVVRGLLLDLLATGDRTAVDGAYRRFLSAFAAAVPESDEAGATSRHDPPLPGRRGR